MEDTIYAPDLVGDLCRYELCSDGLYHWHGITSYAGYTAEELLSRIPKDEK